MRTPLLSLLATLALLTSVGSLRADMDSSESEAPKPVKTSTVPYTISPLDKVTVKSSGEAVHSYQVSQDGTLELGDQTITAAGLTPVKLTSLVRQHTGSATSITIDEFRANRVTLLGEITRPTFTEMTDGPMRVLDAIAAANGFTPIANTRRVKLVRENAGIVEVYELDLRAVMKGFKSNQNILLKPGDVITVPRNFL